MNTSHDPEIDELMLRWRQYVAKHAVSQTKQESDDIRSRYQAAHQRAEERWMPPKVLLSSMLGEMIAGWQKEWTLELRGHSTWRASKSRLTEVRDFLTDGNLLDASMELESLLVECCPTARESLAAPERVRSIDSGKNRQSTLEIRQALEQLLNWLENL